MSDPANLGKDDRESSPFSRESTIIEGVEAVGSSGSAILIPQLPVHEMLNGECSMGPTSRLSRHNPTLRCLKLLALCALMSAFAHRAVGTTSAEVFELANGARLEGALLNPDASPRPYYLIGVSEGVKIALPVASVVRVEKLSDAVVEYERRRVLAPDTIEGQKMIAEWCRTNHLTDMANRHFERVLNFAPDDEAVHRALGHYKSGGEWTTRQKEMELLGLVNRNGRWMTPQEVLLADQRQEMTRREGQWRQSIQLWRSQLGSSQGEQARRAITSINDPLAIGPLVEVLRDERNEKVRELVLSALHRIGTPAADMEIAQWSFEEPFDDLRLTCFEYLKDRPGMDGYFIQALQSSDPGTINDAAFALKHVGDARAIFPLINALVTRHQYKETLGGDNQFDISMGSRGTGLGMGKTEVVRTRESRNADVLEALIELTGGVDFGYNVGQWRNWWKSRRQLAGFDPRRG